MGRVAAGIIVGWPDTEASIPAGWSRVAALDGRYLRGANAAGGTGGSATHTHTLDAHWHTGNAHTHTISGTTGSTTGSGWGGGTGGVRLKAGETHSHTVNAVTSPATRDTDICAAVPLNAASNDPNYWLVIWIESDGSPAGVPPGGLAFDENVPNGWSAPANGKTSFLKGAAAGVDGGPVGGSGAAHTHGGGAHTHAIKAHSHGGVWSDWYDGEEVEAGWAAVHDDTPNPHRHAIVDNSASDDVSAATPTINNANKEFPPYHRLWIVRNDEAAARLPTGIIAAWIGAAGAIPDGWAACDGTLGTPNLNGAQRCVYGANVAGDIGGTGGSILVHAHTSVAHTHAMSGHVHTIANPSGDTVSSNDLMGPDVFPRHNHDTSSLTCSGGTGNVQNFAPGTSNQDSMPPWYGVIFVQWQGGLAGVDALRCRPPDVWWARAVGADPDADHPLDLAEMDGGWNKTTYTPDVDLDADLDGAQAISIVRVMGRIVASYIPDAAGDIHVGFLDEDRYHKAEEAVIEGDFYRVASEKLQGGLMHVVLALQNDAGTLRWYQTVGVWDAAAETWDYETPLVECDTDPGGGFPDAKDACGSLRRTPDGGLLFAMVDDADDIKVMRTKVVEGDGTMTWECVETIAGDWLQVASEMMQASLVYVVAGLKDDAGTLRWYQSACDWDAAAGGFDCVDPMVECDTDPGGGFPDAANACASLRRTPGGGLLFTLIDDGDATRVMHAPVVQNDATMTWEEA